MSSLLRRYFARSYTVIIPTSFPLSSTRSLRMFLFSIFWTASSIGVIGSTHLKLADINSESITSELFLSVVETLRARSLSVTRPMGFPSLTTTRELIPFSANNRATSLDRKSTRLNSSHTVISYAVFCLKKKKKRQQIIIKFVKRYLYIFL